MRNNIISFALAVLISPLFAAAFPDSLYPKPPQYDVIERAIKRLQSDQYVPEADYTNITIASLRAYERIVPITAESTDPRVPYLIFIFIQKKFHNLFGDVIEKRTNAGWDFLNYGLYLELTNTGTPEEYFRRASKQGVKMATYRYALALETKANSTHNTYYQTDRYGHRTTVHDRYCTCFNTSNEWVLYAANKGVTEAQHKLGTDYYNGTNGRKKNIPEARKWFALAAKNGSSTAAQQVTIIDTPPPPPPKGACTACQIL